MVLPSKNVKSFGLAAFLNDFCRPNRAFLAIFVQKARQYDTFGLQKAPKMAPKWLPGGLPEGSRHWGTEFLRKTHWHAHGSRVFETWLSWNGKRVRRESVQALQARRQQREQQEQPEAERQHHQEEQGESGEGRPIIEIASAYYRL